LGFEDLAIGAASLCRAKQNLSDRYFLAIRPFIVPNLPEADFWRRDRLPSGPVSERFVMLESLAQHGSQMCVGSISRTRVAHYTMRVAFKTMRRRRSACADPKDIREIRICLNPVRQVISGSIGEFILRGRNPAACRRDLSEHKNDTPNRSSVVRPTRGLDAEDLFT
jgi:hypothetical protein